MSTMLLWPDAAAAVAERDEARPRWHWLLGAAAVLLVALAGWQATRLASEQSVKQIQIEGRFTRLRVDELQNVVRPLADTRFGALDLNGVRAAVEALPWTAHASVERVWPATLRVRVREREPMARWNDGALLDTESRAFTPLDAALPDGLPQLAGPDGSEHTVAEMYTALARQLRDTVFGLQGLHLDARGEWIAHTVSGAQLRFGREDPRDKLAMLKGPAQRALRDRMAEVDRVDLRYTNGFSVGWREARTTSEGG